MDKWLAANLAYTDGRVKRFGPDERDDGDIPKSIQFDTQAPGGFGSGSLVLPRPPKLRADDAKLFSHAWISGPGNKTAYEGRVTGVPQVGPSEIRLELEGWSAHLDDDETFQEIYSDIDFSHWQGASAQRKLDLIASYSFHDPSVVPDAGQPSLQQGYTGNWNATTGRPYASAYYDAHGVELGSLYWAMKVDGRISPADSNWNIEARLCDDDRSSNVNDSGNLRPGTGSPQTGTVTASGVAKYFSELANWYTNSGGGEGTEHAIWWTCLAVRSKHGLTPRGTESATEAKGFYGSDVLAHALGKAAPLLNYTLNESIEQSTFVIPHLVFKEHTTVRQVIEQVTALGGASNVPNDWGVYENREFYWRSPGSYGRTWRVRKDQVAEPTSEGPDASERISEIKITYRDGSGTNHTVGPPGSGADYETPQLQDTDPQNPANRVGRKRHREVGITNQDGAVLIGQLLLAEANRVDWRGTTKIQGEATDSADNTLPAYMVRAGDRIVIEDDEDPTERAINSTSYSHDDMTMTANSGASPHQLEVLLAQLAAVTDLKVGG